MNDIKEKIFKMLNSGEILLADYLNQNLFPDMENQGLMLDEYELAARIGGNWFYYNTFDKSGNIKDFTLEEHAEMIAEVIENLDGFGIGEDEAEFYRNCISI